MPVESPSIVPVVGMGCTKLCHSDREAYTVIDVDPRGRWAIVQEDTAKLLNGINSDEPDRLIFAPGGFAGHTSGKQRWECTPDPNGSKVRIILNSKGVWKESGNAVATFILNERTPHYDFNF